MKLHHWVLLILGITTSLLSLHAASFRAAPTPLPESDIQIPWGGSS